MIRVVVTEKDLITSVVNSPTACAMAKAAERALAGPQIGSVTDVTVSERIIYFTKDGKRMQTILPIEAIAFQRKLRYTDRFEMLPVMKKGKRVWVEPFTFQVGSGVEA